MKSEIDLPSHRAQLKKRLLSDFSALNHEGAQSMSEKTSFFNWRTVLASGVLTLLLVTVSLQLPFSKNGGPKVSAKEIVAKAKEKYQTENPASQTVTHPPEYYDRFSVWDYFPIANPTDDNNLTENDNDTLSSTEEEFDEFGLFEVLDNYSETDFATAIIEENDQEFYELELWQDGKKIKFLISPADYALLQVDIFAPAADNPQELVTHFSRRWP